jgi:hypothetical protein
VGQVHPQTFPGGDRGILMSDGYQGWRTLKGATMLDVWAHARRRFDNLMDRLRNDTKGSDRRDIASRLDHSGHELKLRPIAR